MPVHQHLQPLSTYDLPADSTPSTMQHTQEFSQPAVACTSKLPRFLLPLHTLAIALGLLLLALPAATRSWAAGTWRQAAASCVLTVPLCWRLSLRPAAGTVEARCKNTAMLGWVVEGQG